MGALPTDQTRKIQCGKAHFAALGMADAAGDRYIGPVKTVEQFMDRAL